MCTTDYCLLHTLHVCDQRAAMTFMCSLANSVGETPSPLGLDFRSCRYVFYLGIGFKMMYVYRHMQIEILCK